jgi:hypothetical protein
MKTQTVTLRVLVVFPAAGKPFKDDDASRDETVDQLEARVLEDFGLTEGPIGNNEIAVFTLFHGKQKLDNPAQTLGEVAGDKPQLQLKLSQRIVQGG